MSSVVLDKQQPFVSIVMPTYNRAAFLERCLPPLFQQSYPADRYEVILVDDGSTDDTADRADRIAQPWADRFRRIRQTNGGPASARNTGFRASSAVVIAFIDSDCIASVSWLSEMVGALMANRAAGVGGIVRGVASDGWVSRYIDVTGLMRQRVKNGRVDYLITANTVFLREALVNIGGFDDRFRLPGGDDVDLCFRLQKAGETLIAIDAGTVQHYHRQTVGSLAHMFFRYGQGSYTFSSNWQNRRPPAVELIRHTGAFVLAPWLALSHIRRAGVSLGWLFVFWPLTMVEHGAFTLGYLTGIMAKYSTGSR
jgi:glycosyltransferase involved in cell wall biosynthesis